MIHNQTEKPTTEIVEKILEGFPKKLDEILEELKPNKLDEILEELKQNKLDEILEEAKPKKQEEILENPISIFPNQQDPSRKVVRVVKRPKNGSQPRPVNLNKSRRLGKYTFAYK